jgi:hypothetical protein
MWTDPSGKFVDCGKYPDHPQCSIDGYDSGVETNTEQALDDLQTFLDAGGLIPVVGEPLDLINGGLYALRGDWGNAGLSCAAAIPLLGWGATGVKFSDEAFALMRWEDEGGRVADEVFVVLSRQDSINLLVESMGTNIRNHPKRQAYQDAVANIAEFSRQRIDELGGPSPEVLEQVAQESWLRRRQIGEQYKDVTPLALRHHIYAKNVERYGHPLGPSYEELSDTKTPEQIIAGAARPNPDVDKLLKDFRPWLATQSDETLERYVADLLERSP